MRNITKTFYFINTYFYRQKSYLITQFFIKPIVEYTSNSFGIYQEEPFDVELKFSKEAADDVMNYYFHPTQEIKPQEDGTVTVAFKSGGSYAICWHLFTWGKDVEIVKPKKLQNLYKKLLSEAMQSF